MKNLISPAAIKFKGLLFLITGIFAGVLLFLQEPTLLTAALIALTVWCFCRAYYFAFYVIEHYVDPGFHFSGLWSFALYLIKKPKNPRQ